MQESAIRNLLDILAFIDRSEKCPFVIKDCDEEPLSIRDKNQALRAYRIRPAVGCGANFPYENAFVKFFYGIEFGTEKENVPFMLLVIGRYPQEIVLDRDEEHFGVDVEIV